MRTETSWDVLPEASGELTRCEPFELREGDWPCFLTGRVETFLLPEERPWRARKALETVELAKRTGDPMASLGMLRGASALVGVDMERAVEEAERVRLPGESLASSYLRATKR